MFGNISYYYALSIEIAIIQLACLSPNLGVTFPYFIDAKVLDMLFKYFLPCCRALARLEVV